MMGRTVVLVVILCWAVGMGCSNKNSVPKGILPMDKMEQVMWDMAQADQYAALYLAKDSAHSDRKAETMRLYAEVFRLHEVTPEEFRKSYHYYLDHPELNQLLFDSVITRGFGHGQKCITGLRNIVRRWCPLGRVWEFRAERRSGGAV